MGEWTGQNSQGKSECNRCLEIRSHVLKPALFVFLKLAEDKTNKSNVAAIKIWQPRAVLTERFYKPNGLIKRRVERGSF